MYVHVCIATEICYTPYHSGKRRHKKSYWIGWSNLVTKYLKVQKYRWVKRQRNSNKSQSNMGTSRKGVLRQLIRQTADTTWNKQKCRKRQQVAIDFPIAPSCPSSPNELQREKTKASSYCSSAGLHAHQYSTSIPNLIQGQVNSIIYLVILNVASFQIQPFFSDNTREIWWYYSGLRSNLWTRTQCIRTYASKWGFFFILRLARHSLLPDYSLKTTPTNLFNTVVERMKEEGFGQRRPPPVKPTWHRPLIGARSAACE